MKWLRLAPLLVVLSACSSPEKARELEASDYKDEVISRINDLKARPEWLDESRSFWVSKGEVFSLGRTTFPGDGRVEMGYRVAENSAKVGLASAIEQKLSAVFQAAEEGAGFDANQYRFIGSEVTRLSTSSLRTKSRYWEKVLSRDTSGAKVVRYEIFALVSMPESDFKSAVLAAVRRAQGKAGLSQDFAAKASREWDRITGEETAPAEAAPPKAAQKQPDLQ